MRVRSCAAQSRLHNGESTAEKHAANLHKGGHRVSNLSDRTGGSVTPLQRLLCRRQRASLCAECVCVCVCIQVDYSCFCSLYRLVFQDSVLSPRLPQVGSPEHQTPQCALFSCTTSSDLINHLLIWEHVFIFIFKSKTLFLLDLSTNYMKCALLPVVGKASVCLFTKLLNWSTSVSFLR